jgi:hypothetical protein
MPLTISTDAISVVVLKYCRNAAAMRRPQPVHQQNNPACSLQLCNLQLCNLQLELRLHRYTESRKPFL